MPSISCLEFNRLLAQAVESRLPVEAAELRGHAAACADCRAAWLETRLLDCAVAQWKSQYQSMAKSTTPSVDLTDVVLFRLAAEREAALSVPGSPIGKRGAEPAAAVELVGMAAPAARAVASRPQPIVSRRAVAAAAMVAAAVLCVAFLSGRMTRQPGAIETAKRTDASLLKEPALGQPSASAKRVTPPVPGHKEHRAESARQMADISSTHVRGSQLPNSQSAASEAPTTEAMVQDAGSAYLNLASEAAQAVTAATVLVPRPGSVGGTAPAAEANDRWVDDVSREFQPVSKNLSEAFEFLFEAVPTEKAPAT